MGRYSEMVHSGHIRIPDSGPYKGPMVVASECFGECKHAFLEQL